MYKDIKNETIENEKKEKIKRFISYILIAVIIILGISRITYAFTVEKNDSHSDEEWSYGIANSTNGPYLFMVDDYIDEGFNMNKWTDGVILHNYLTVQPNERFDFYNVFYNCQTDLHPPLYFMLLHAISSLYPDSFSWWYGFIINLFAFILASIYLYKWVYLLTESKKVSLLTLFYHTLCIGTISIFIYIRMYALLISFMIIFCYLQAKFAKNSYKNMKWFDYACLVAITFLGCMTHNYFVLFAFIFACIITVYLLAKKEIRDLCKYGFSVLGGAMLAILAFPPTINHLLGQSIAIFNPYTVKAADTFSNHPEPPGIFTFNLYMYGLMMKDLFGFNPITLFYRHQIVFLILAMILLLSLMGIIYKIYQEYKRDNKISSTKENVNQENIKQFILKKMTNLSIYYITLIISSIYTIFTIVNSSDIINMKQLSTRYIFMFYPVSIVLFVLFLSYIINKYIYDIKKAHMLLCIILLSTLILNTVSTKNAYLFYRDKGGITIDNFDEDDNIIIVSSKNWLITVYSVLMPNVNKYYITDYEEYFEKTDNLADVSPDDGSLYLVLDISELKNIDPYIDDMVHSTPSHEIIDNEIDQTIYEYLEFDKELTYSLHNTPLEYSDYINYISNVYPDYEINYIGYDQVFKREVAIYEIK